MAQRTDLTLQHRLPLYCLPATQSGAIISSTEPLLWTLRPRPPLPPPSPLSKGPKWSLVCALWTLTPCPAAPLRNRDVPEAARLLDGRSSFPKVKYSPSESDSANNICNTSSQYNFLLVIWRFSLTIYSHAMNWTASASMTRSLTCPAISSNTLNRNMT